MGFFHIDERDQKKVYTPIIKIMCCWHLKCIFCVLGAVNQTLDDLLLFKKAQNDLKVSTVRILQKERQLCFVSKKGFCKPAVQTFLVSAPSLGKERADTKNVCMAGQGFARAKCFHI